MKRTYLTAEFIFSGQPTKGYQEIENGSVTGYFDLDGNPVDGFISCATKDEVQPPAWAPDYNNDVAHVSETLTDYVESLAPDKAEVFAKKIIQMIDEEQA